MTGLFPWVLVFTTSSVVVVGAGILLARFGDEIATRTELGGVFVGTLLMAAATSLPEIVTVLSAATAGAADVAAGGLFGSSLANMAILGLVDLLHRRPRVWVAVDLGHARVAAVAIALTAVALFGMVAPAAPAVGWVGLDTVFVAGAYVAAVAWMRRSPDPGRLPPEVPPVPTGWSEPEHPAAPLRPTVTRFGLAAVAIVVAGPAVALSAEGIAAATGISQAFAGVVLLAVATSLPELVASLGAVRIGAYDLAVGNLFGSNAFNMVILVLADAADTSGPLLTRLSPAQIVTGAGAIGLMGVALAALVHGRETRATRLEPDAVVLLVGYVGTLAAVAATP